MRIFGALVALALGALILLSFGPRILGHPPMAEKTQDIELFQTAFLVPLMGENKDSQAQVTSSEALAQHKVIGKRVSIPLRQKKTGYVSYEWVDSMALIVVDRTPIMEVWSGDPFHGQVRPQDLALRVQSKDGIKFAVPAVISAVILDEDAAVFQARYRGKSLNDIVNSDVRNYAQAVLSEKFAAFDLDECRRQKITFIDDTNKALSAYFKKTGITIEYFGLLEGLIFDNRDVQKAIVSAYVNNLEGQRLKHAIKAENTRNTTKSDTANTDRQIAAIAEEIQEPLRLMRVIQLAKDQAALVIDASKKFSSSIPTQVLPAGNEQTNLMLPIPGPSSSK